MPESEPKPKLIELVGPGAGQGWKAVLKNGKAVVVHEIPVPPAEAAAAVPRLQRLYEHRHPALSPVLAWGTDAAGVWVAVEPNEGTPLGSILSRGPLTPPAAAALGAAVLSAVAALHEDGIAMGGFNAASVRVNGNGEARLAGHPSAAVRGAPSQSDLRADVRSCGMAVCAAFGVDPAGAPAPPNIPPGLVVTMRSMASGAMGPAADRAMGALREMASALLAPDRQVAAQSELALRSGGREMPPVTPFLPGEQPRPTAPTPAVAAPVAFAPPPPQAPPPSPPSPQAPAHEPEYVPPQGDETPIPIPASYDAPDRPLQTYSGLRAIPVPPAPVPAPAAPATPAAPTPSSDAIPTWAEAPARTASPETVPPPSTIPPPATVPPTPALEPAASAPATNPPGLAETPAPSQAPATWEPAAPRSPFDSVVPGAVASAASAPVEKPVEKPLEKAVEKPLANPVEQPKPAATSWSTAEAPVWQPGEVQVRGFESKAPAPAPVAAVSEAPAPASPAPAPAAAPVMPPSRPSAPTRRPPPARRPAISLPPERPAWLVPAAVAVIVILLLGAGSIFLVSKLGSSNGGGHAATTTPSAKASAHASASPSSETIHQVPTLAPAAAGQIQSVQFCTTATPCPFTGDKDTNCTINGPCALDVGVIFTSTYTGPYSYDIMYFDRCAGGEPQTLLSHSDSSRAFKIGEPASLLNVQLPANAKSAALFVVTRTPAGAQSAALKLGADSCS